MKQTITLKKNYEFKNLLKRGKWRSGKYITVHVLPYKDINENRIGFIVSKKSGNSVFRNRTRRIIRQAYYDLEKNVKKGNQILFIWKTKNTDKDLKCIQIYDDMNNILKESDLLL